MRFDNAFCLVTLLTAVSAAGIDPRRHVERIDSNTYAEEQDLYKRRGGGGGGGRGGGSSGGSRGSGSSGGGNRGGSGGGSSGGGRPPPNARPNSNQGGTSRAGSGPQPNYGGGRYYGGGARRPYAAGAAIGGLAAFALLPIAALAFWPGTWYGPAYGYRYGAQNRDDDMYEYYNITTDEDEKRQILCACQEDQVCGCEPNDDLMEELIGNGSYAALNKTIINVGSENGTDYFLLNGTLPKGTTLEDPDADEQSDDDDAGAGYKALLEALGFWPATAAVACAVFLA